jgi:hypothetical protein
MGVVDDFHEEENEEEGAVRPKQKNDDGFHNTSRSSSSKAAAAQSVVRFFRRRKLFMFATDKTCDCSDSTVDGCGISNDQFDVELSREDSHGASRKSNNNFKYPKAI